MFQYLNIYSQRVLLLFIANYLADSCYPDNGSDTILRNVGFQDEPQDETSQKQHSTSLSQNGPFFGLKICKSPCLHPNLHTDTPS
jgi:hypothetical protein